MSFIRSLFWYMLRLIEGMCTVFVLPVLYGIGCIGLITCRAGLFFHRAGHSLAFKHIALWWVLPKAVLCTNTKKTMSSCKVSRI